MADHVNHLGIQWKFIFLGPLKIIDWWVSEQHKVILMIRGVGKISLAMKLSKKSVIG